jgi:hypothetical protein
VDGGEAHEAYRNDYLRRGGTCRRRARHQEEAPQGIASCGEAGGACFVRAFRFLHTELIKTFKTNIVNTNLPPITGGIFIYMTGREISIVQTYRG